ncbi:AAA family ATPase [Paracoccaceae bacterium]|nr:AAA family ATPase [Paracoccaceae bacterium]
MRPLKLTIEAFGPFAGKEVVNFLGLADQQLFGVYGQTGSGKSSIFDAIAFALFGESMKGDLNYIRSHYSDIDTLCRVEFIFETSNKTFLVERSPTQSSSTRKDIPGTANLFDVTGIPVNEISHLNRGRVISEKKLTETTREIIKILGYGFNEFKRIVLLPQGEFQEFLLSNTKKKKEILRKLFHVSFYRNLAKNFLEETKNIKSEIEALTQLRLGLLNSKEFSTIEELQKSLIDERNKTEELKRNTKENIERFDKISDRKKNYDALMVNREKLSRLLDEELHHNEIKQTIRKLNNTTILEASYKAVEEKKSISKRDSTAYAEAKIVLDNTSTDSKKIESELYDLCKQSGEFDIMRNELKTLEEYLKRLEDAKVDQEEVTSKEKKIQNLKIALTKKDLDRELNKAKAFEKKKHDIISLKRDAKDREIEVDVLKNKIKTCDENFREAEKTLSDMQAIHLSKKLVEGEACPVCGSLKHPSPATGKRESKGLNEAFERAKKLKEETEIEYSKNSLALSVVETKIIESEKSFTELTPPAKSSEEIQKKLLEIGAHIDEAGNEQDESALKEILNKEEKIYYEQLGSLKQLLRGIPEEFKDINLVEEKKKFKQNRIDAYDKHKERLENQSITLSKKIEGLESKVQTLQQVAGSSKKSADKSEKEFLQSLEKYKFEDKTEFENYLPQIPQLEALKEKLRRYETSVDEVKGAIKSHEEASKTSEKLNPEELEKKFTETKALKEESENELSSNYLKIDDLSSLQSKVEDCDQKLKNMEDSQLSFINLSEIFNAQKTGQSIGLETYALSKMFELVLKTANKRLKIMTPEYELEIKTETKGGGEHGLDISVNDLFLGEKRDVTTLSGGERFMASLSLALGLSEVVQSSSRKNIRLDTIFIDEGFGSLDNDGGYGTLGRVLTTLQQNVSSIRAVGLVSHVDTVKEAVPSGFYIEKKPTGSHVKLLLE